ncbi:MAG: glycosyltransferase [Microcoleaceae cyanobacterium]
MTRIAIFLTSLDGGGAERSMVNLMRGLVAQNVQVDLVLVKREGPYLRLVPPQVRIIDFDQPRLLMSLPDLVRYLRRERPEALLSSLEDTNVIAILARFLARVPTRVVVNVQNTVSQEHRYAASLKKRLAPQLARLFYPLADAIVPVSKGVAQDLTQLGLPAKQIVVVNNPVVTPELHDRAAEPLDHPWFVPGQPPVILAVGRLDRQKDFPTLIRAFAQVYQQVSARLLILGEGQDRPELESLVQSFNLTEAVSLPGFVDNPYAYMANAAVLVLSSLYEGLPTVLIEAMASGTAVVATDCPSGPVEILNHGQYGPLVKIGDVEGLAQAIVRTLQDPPNLKVIQERAAEFSVQRSVERYREVLGV